MKWLWKTLAILSLAVVSVLAAQRLLKWLYHRYGCGDVDMDRNRER